MRARTTPIELFARRVHRPVIRMPKLTCALLLALGLAFAGCQRRPADFAVISDAGKEQFLTLTRLGQHRLPASARLQIKGTLNGAATLILLRGGRPYVTRELPAGKVDAEWHGDWHSNQLMLHYLPGSVNVGALQIIYEFSD
jgi:hypothetical protein